MSEIITLKRTQTDDDGTFGTLWSGDMQIAVTCEDPDYDNAQEISCIPAGVYECTPYSSPKYPNVWEVKDVPGRSKILIHAGNTEDDTRGCILAGTAFGRVKGKPAVVNSKIAMDHLRSELPDYFTLEIIWDDYE